MTAVPFQKPGAAEASGLTREECQQAAWAVSTDGRRFRGAEAINAALAYSLDWPAVLRFYYLPGIRSLQDLVYFIITKIRPYLPGTVPHCEAHPEDCSGVSSADLK